MKRKLFKTILFGAAVSAFTLAGCKKDNDGDGGTPPPDADRWITLSGALMDETAGDGNGGTMVYSIKVEDARNPDVSVKVFDEGMHVKSSRTARLQASADGNDLYNIQYTGDDGGIFNKYKVLGAGSFQNTGVEVDIEPYAGTSPRWVVAAPGIGIAVHATGVTTFTEGEAPNHVFKYRRGTARIVALDLDNPKILKTAEFPMTLSAEDEAAGYNIGRIDVPVINKAGNKVFIGASVSKVDPTALSYNASGQPVFATDNSVRGATKTIVVDYPSLENPKILVSTQATGNNNGYRSKMMFVGDDGHVYQATHGEGIGNGGAKILRISSSTNDYDNNYVLSLDQALGETDTYVETWIYAGDGIGYVVYSLVRPNGTGTSRTGGYVARVDLNAKTATKMNVPNGENLNFGQHQNIAIHGDEVFLPVTGVGLDGNIYIFNRKTGAMSVGAKLINKTGNRYIGAY